jgi:hypothetical protein
MNSAPNPKATEPDDVLIVRADERLAHTYQQIAHADEQITKSTPNPKATEPDDVLIVRADERLAHTHQQIAHADEQITEFTPNPNVECADEQLAHVTEQPSKPDHDATRHPSAVPGRLPSRGRPALRGLIGLLLATCIFVAAFVSQSPYGGAAKLRWAAQLVLTSSLPLKKPGLPVQPSPSAAQVVAAESMPSQPTPSAQTAPQEVAPTAAPLSPELAQMLQTMVRDLANVEQGVEQLKTSQQQIASDNAKAIEQLKTSQEQMARDNAKAAEQLKASQEQIARFIAKAFFPEQNLRPKTSAPPPGPIANPTR